MNKLTLVDPISHVGARRVPRHTMDDGSPKFCREPGTRHSSVLAYLQLPILSAKEVHARRAKGGGTRGVASARSTRTFPSDAGAWPDLFRLMRRHPRSPGGLAGAAMLPLAAPEPPT